MKDIIKPALVLAVITTVAAVLLSFTYVVVEPKIAAQGDADLKEALRQVMPEADDFELVGDELYEAYSSGEKVGNVVVAYGPGYSSEIKTLVGVDNDKKVTSIKVLYQVETPGLGTKIEEDSFTGQFSGKEASELVLGEGIDAITGATVSSKAVADSVKEAIEAIE